MNRDLKKITSNADKSAQVLSNKETRFSFRRTNLLDILDIIAYVKKAIQKFIRKHIVVVKTCLSLWIVLGDHWDFLR